MSAQANDTVPDPEAPPVVSGATRAEVPPRAVALDAVRGLSILGMVMADVVPGRILPSWMYHAQEPPPTNEQNENVAGLTWTDLVFPFFLFALGAAIPIAFGNRLRRGVRKLKLVVSVFERGLLLVFFALIRQHSDAYVAGFDRPAMHVVALAMFCALFLIFVRFPERTPRRTQRILRIAGWIAAIGLIFALPPERTFSFERADIILMILAYTATFGALIWLVTRDNLPLRLGVLAFLVVLRLSGWEEGWLHHVYDTTWLNRMYQFSYFQFLGPVIPGTIVGDLLVRWIRGEDSAGRPRWTNIQYAALVLGAVALLLVVLTGIQARYVGATTALASGLCAAVLLSVRDPGDATERMLRQFVSWATFFLILGLFLDPFDHGMRKVPETWSWFFASTGLAIFTLTAFVVIANVWRKQRALQLLVDNGQNPMIAYVGWGMVVFPLLSLAGVMGRIYDATEKSVPLGMTRAFILLGVVALIVRFFTRRKLFWRA